MQAKVVKAVKALRYCPLLWLALLTILADVGLAVPATRYWSAFILLWLLPGLAWAGLLTGRHRRPTAEEIAVGLGLGIGTVVLLTLLLHYIPGPLTFPALLVTVNLLIFGLIFLTPHPSLSDPRLIIRHSPFAIRHPSFAIFHFSFFIILAAFFRLLYLGYSEFQGDEGIVMMRAARVILGDDEQLFYHQKGPAEVLLPMATWTLSGTINEWQARLPFALVGLLGVVALYLLGRRWFNGRSALVAALLLAINGYFVGFGRIVQYQGLVLATTTLALLALWRWSEGEGRQWLIVGAALLAFGLLAHYDAGLALPAAAYVVGRRLWIARSRWRAFLVDVLIAGALALGILALFYLPFACHPNFAKTLGYLSGARIGTGGPLYNNLLSSLPLATFYNSAYYLIGLACLLIVASFLPFRRLGLLIPTACYLLLILQSPVPSFQSPIWMGPVLTGLLATILLSRHSSAPSRAAWLWSGVPFLFYYFLVWDPRTHVLNVFPGAVLLAASALDYLLTFVLNLVPPPPRHWSLLTVHWSLVIVHCSLFIFLAYYPYLMFVQHDPEIKRTWPAHQPALYWRPDDEMPLFGYFGFPYRAGWKVIGALVEDGVLNGVYASNEEQEVAGWYTRGAERTYCPNPEWYLIAQNVQDEVPIHQADIEATYHLWGEIRVAGEPKLRIYHRDPPPPWRGDKRGVPPPPWRGDKRGVPPPPWRGDKRGVPPPPWRGDKRGVPPPPWRGDKRGVPPPPWRGDKRGVAPSPTVFHVEDYTFRFDAGTTPVSVTAMLPTDYTPAGYTLGEAVRLLGYHLDTVDVRPGGSICLVLYWEALRPIETNYQVFNHLYDGTMWGQQDGTPGCTLRPTVLWGPGQIVRDEYTIPIDPLTPAGDIPLLVGMYSLGTGERLPVRGPDGVPIGDAIPLAVVTVR